MSVEEIRREIRVYTTRKINPFQVKFHVPVAYGIWEHAEWVSSFFPEWRTQESSYEDNYVGIKRRRTTIFSVGTYPYGRNIRRVCSPLKNS